jgi:hypothetical protein
MCGAGGARGPRMLSAMTQVSVDPMAARARTWQTSWT